MDAWYGNPSKTLVVGENMNLENNPLLPFS